MALDPKKLTEWKRLVEEAARERVAMPEYYLTAREALPALIEEVERLAGERDEARDRVRRLTNEQWMCVYCGHADPPGSPTHGAEVLAHIKVCPKHPMRDAEAALQRVRDGAGAALSRAKTEMERLRALLREVEWSRPGGAGGCLDLCPVCHGSKPYEVRGLPVDGHTPGCRLAAALKEE